MSAAEVPPILLRPEEAANRLGISRSKLYQLLAAGHLASIKIGGSRRIPQESLVDYVTDLRETR